MTPIRPIETDVRRRASPTCSVVQGRRWGARLRDFRLTMWAARDRAHDQIATAASRALANALGKKAWALFCGQITTFGAGILLTVVVVGVPWSKAAITKSPSTTRWSGA